MITTQPSNFQWFAVIFMMCLYGSIALMVVNGALVGARDIPATDSIPQLFSGFYFLSVVITIALGSCHHILSTCLGFVVFPLFCGRHLASLFAVIILAATFSQPLSAFWSGGISSVSLSIAGYASIAMTVCFLWVAFKLFNWLFLSANAAYSCNHVGIIPHTTN